MKVYRDYDQKGLDDQYEQRVWAPNAEELIRRYGEKSNEVRKRLGEPRVERYGASEPETLDIYGSGNKAFVFVHGGAWRRQTSREQAFPAEPFVAAGAAYVALNFAKLPAVALPEMTAQVRRGIEWVRQNLCTEIVVCGHSSGAHLAACALTAVPARGGLFISGVYDLAPVRLSSRNDYMRLDERLERDYSPLRHAARIRCPATVAWGEKESVEFLRQSKEFAAALQAATLEGKGLNHFEIVETLGDARSPLGRAALNMLQ